MIFISKFEFVGEWIKINWKMKIKINWKMKLNENDTQINRKLNNFCENSRCRCIKKYQKTYKDIIKTNDMSWYVSIKNIFSCCNKTDTYYSTKINKWS